MIANKGSRKIAFRGITLRYKISTTHIKNGNYSLNITIQSEKHNASKLIVKGLKTRDFWLDFSDPPNNLASYPIILRKDIIDILRTAIDEQQWDYSTPSPEHHLVWDNQSLTAWDHDARFHLKPVQDLT